MKGVGDEDAKYNYKFFDYSEIFDEPEGNDGSGGVKVKVAIGFAVACAVLLLAVFILLLYKVLWFRSNQNSKGPPASRVVEHAPSVTERDFKHSRLQRRYEPLMRTDSSSSDLVVDSRWRNNNQLTSPTDSDSGEAFLNLGRLEFNINYDTETECLKVSVLAAYDLPAIHSTSYVELYLLPDRVEKHQTGVQYNNSSPVFNEEFQFDVGYSELSERTLQCCVYSYDGFSRHQSIGEVFYSFGEDDQLSEGKVMSLCKDIKRDVFLLKEESPSRVGEVLVSLCYLPTTNRLTFVVLKARLSKSVFPGDPPNPFVKVSLMLTGRQIKKTKTSIAKSTLLPVYNEAFVFDVPIHRLSDVSLLLRVLNSADGASSNGVASLHHDMRTLGKAIVGPDARTSIGLHHWNCMMTTPRKPIAQWHPLMKT